MTFKRHFGQYYYHEKYVLRCLQGTKYNDQKWRQSVFLRLHAVEEASKSLTSDNNSKMEQDTVKCLATTLSKLDQRCPSRLILCVLNFAAISSRFKFVETMPDKLQI